MSHGDFSHQDIRAQRPGPGATAAAGGRVGDLMVRVRDAAYLILAYAKSAQAEISNDQPKAIKAFIEGLS